MTELEAIAAFDGVLDEPGRGVLCYTWQPRNPRPGVRAIAMGSSVAKTYAAANAYASRVYVLYSDCGKEVDVNWWGDTGKVEGCRIHGKNSRLLKVYRVEEEDDYE